MEFSDEITEGYIIRSEPAEGEPLKKGDIVRLILSKGPEKKEVTVPSFVGQPIDQVLRELVDTWHLTCTESDIEYVESEQETNTIIWQSLETTAKVTEWDTIKFRVSKGITIAERETDILLPQDGRTTVDVEVYVGDEENPQFHERVQTADGYVHVWGLKGSGTKTIKVYFDGVFAQDRTQEIDFT